jgi:hypothetical protein
VCAKEIKTELTTLDGADFVRDGDKRISRHLFWESTGLSQNCDRTALAEVHVSENKGLEKNHELDCVDRDCLLLRPSGHPTE